MKPGDKVTVSMNGTPTYSTWVQGFWRKGRSVSVYMKNGAVFSKATHKQMPYSLNSSKTFSVVG